MLVLFSYICLVAKFQTQIDETMGRKQTEQKRRKQSPNRTEKTQIKESKSQNQIENEHKVDRKRKGAWLQWRCAGSRWWSPEVVRWWSPVVVVLAKFESGIGNVRVGVSD